MASTVSEGPGARSRGGRPPRAGATEAILEATIALAEEVGLEAVTMDAIAVRAGVSRPTVYRRWPTKDALVEEALDLMVDRYRIQPDNGNIRDDLIEFARITIDRVQGSHQSLMSLFYSVKQTNFAPALFARAREHNLSIVRRGIERGELRPDLSPELVLEIILATIWFQVTARHQHLDAAYAESLVDVVLFSSLAGPD